MSLKDTYEHFLDGEARKYPGLVRDGIVDYDMFVRQQIRILWILKETNDPNGICRDLREFLKAPTSYSKWKRTWLPVLQISHGLLSIWDKVTENYITIKSKMEANISEYLPIFRKIAVININKFSGDQAISYKELKEKYAQFKNTIISQVKLINPDVIICCGVFWVMWNDLNKFKVEKDELDYRLKIINENIKKIKAHYNSRRIFIETLHPNQRNISRKLYYDSILEGVKNWLNMYKKF